MTAQHVQPPVAAHATCLLSAAQAAERLGVHESTVRELWNTGELRFVRLGRGRKVSDAELARFIAAHEETAP